MKNILFNAIIAALVTFLVVSCGGGGSDNGRDYYVNRQEGEGIWNASFETIQADWGTVSPYNKAQILVTPDREVFLRYEDEKVAFGNITTRAQSNSRTEFRGTLNFPDRGTSQATFTGTIHNNNRLEGTIQFPGQAATEIRGDYDNDQYARDTSVNGIAGHYNGRIAIDHDGNMSQLVTLTPETMYEGTLKKVSARKNLYQITNGTYQNSNNLKGYAYVDDEGIIIFAQQDRTNANHYTVSHEKKFPNDKEFVGLWYLNYKNANHDNDSDGYLLLTPNGRVALYNPNCTEALGDMTDVTGDEDKLKFTINIKLTDSVNQCSYLANVTKLTATIEDDKISLDTANSDDVWTGKERDLDNGFDIVRNYASVTTTDEQNNTQTTSTGTINGNKGFTITNSVVYIGTNQNYTEEVTGHMSWLSSESPNAYKLTNVEDHFSTSTLPEYVDGTGYAIATEDGVAFFVIPGETDNENQADYSYFFLSRQ